MTTCADRIRRSIELLCDGRVAYEFRTTVVPGILAEDDIAQVTKLIAGADRYYLQQFVPRNTLDPEMLTRVPYSTDRIRAMADLAGFSGIRYRDGVQCHL